MKLTDCTFATRIEFGNEVRECPRLAVRRIGARLLTWLISASPGVVRLAPGRVQIGAEIRRIGVAAGR